MVEQLMFTVIAIIAIPLLIGVFVWENLRVLRKQKNALRRNIDLACCEICGDTHAAFHKFFALRSFGIPLVLGTYELTIRGHSLRPAHARARATACCRTTGLQGHWGFPGFLVSPWYVGRNLWSLKKARALTPGCLVRCVVHGVLLGWLVCLAGIAALLIVCILLLRLFY